MPEKINQEKMNIVLCMNSKYVMPSVVCITSILENNKNPIDFYILYSFLTKKEIDFIEQNIKKSNQKSSLIPIKVQDDIFKDGPIHGRSKEAYFRLLIPMLLPKNLDRCLYLDGDTIVNKSLEDFDNKAFIVCEDLGELIFYHKERHSLLGIPQEYRYFNSGVLLFNLNYFKENYNFDIILNYIKNNSEKLKFLDQDVLNALFYDKVKFTKSNLYDYLEILVSHLLVNDNMNKAVIVHFLQKPWRYTYNGINAKYWWKYGKNIYKFEYIKFNTINFFYRKSLALYLVFLPISFLKKIKLSFKK
jgi:lipopolysaccharide biosynthesis glycosyltransferase